MEKGYYKRGTRAKEGAYDTIDNVTKFALEESDYEEYEEWVEYTPEEIAEMEAQEAEAAKKAEQDALLEQMPSYFAALTSAFGEVE